MLTIFFIFPPFQWLTLGLQTALNMNKQPSKESLKDKVKGMLGLGPTRISTKPTEAKPSEFIITLDILKVWSCFLIISVFLFMEL